MRSVEFLLKFLGALLSRYSRWVTDIAAAFPHTLHTRAQYLCDKLFVPPMLSVFSATTSISFQCFDQHQGHMLVKKCTECNQRASLVKEITTNTGNKRFYPHTYCSLISVLQAFFQRPGFLNLCSSWQKNTYLGTDLSVGGSGRSSCIMKGVHF